MTTVLFIKIAINILNLISKIKKVFKNSKRSNTFKYVYILYSGMFLNVPENLIFKKYLKYKKTYLNTLFKFIVSLNQLRTILKMSLKLINNKIILSKFTKSFYQLVSVCKKTNLDYSKNCKNVKISLIKAKTKTTSYKSLIYGSASSLCNNKGGLLSLGVPVSNTQINLIPKQINVIKRTMFRSATVVSKKVLSPQVLLEQKKMLENKALLLDYCLHFQKYSLATLLNDHFFVDMMHKSIHEEPTRLSRAFQLALEVTYSKRKFNEETLKRYYKNDFVIQDNFEVNNGVCDQSTIYTSIIAKKIVTYFNLDCQDLVVNSTPLYLTKEKITEPVKSIMDYNKKMTENTCPDFELKGRPYDLKEQKDISYGKNQIYLLDVDQITKKGLDIFNKLENSLNNSIHDRSIKLSKETVEFTNSIIIELVNQRNLQTPIQTRIDSLNIFLMKKDIPRDFKMPLFVPIKKFKIENFPMTNVDNNTVPLDPGHLDYVRAKKALMGILDNYPVDVKFKIEEATCNSIQFNIPKIEEVD